MNNGTLCYTQVSFISLQDSYHMGKSPEVTNKQTKKSKAFNNFIKVITTVINMKNHF